MSEPHGTARLTDNGETLIITTKRKVTRKRKSGNVVEYVDNVRKYKVEKNEGADPEVASPAFVLITEEGESYHLGVDKWGCFCQCPDGHFKRENDETKCKHVRACQAVGLLPKPRV